MHQEEDRCESETFLLERLPVGVHSLARCKQGIATFANCDGESCWLLVTAKLVNWSLVNKEYCATGSHLRCWCGSLIRR